MVKNKKEKMMIDVFAHKSVPKHEILNKRQTIEVLQRHHLKPHQLPYIKHSDPAIIVLGAKPGDVIRITRESSTAGQCYSYRYVIGDRTS